MERKRIAIVGSGISGISALWTLRNAGHEVHLFEAADRLGGHTNTVNWKHNGLEAPVDTGFIVLNTATYRMSAFDQRNAWSLTNAQRISSNFSAL